LVAERFDEGQLRFEFVDGWSAIQYDAHPFYRRKLQKNLEATKAVDFLTWSEDVLAFVEVKDFRGHRIVNKHRIASGKLAQEVATKVRDTCAAVLPLARQLDDLRAVRPRWLDGDKTQIEVVLWLELDEAKSPTARYLDKQRLSTMTNVLKRQLGWLTKRVVVTDRASAPSGLAGIASAHSLVGARQARNRQLHDEQQRIGKTGK
jgi:hypothetical protein